MATTKRAAQGRTKRSPKTEARRPVLQLHRGGVPRRPPRTGLPIAAPEPGESFVAAVVRPVGDFEFGDLILVRPSHQEHPLSLVRDLTTDDLAALLPDALEPLTAGPMPDLLARSLRRPATLRLVSSV